MGRRVGTDCAALMHANKLIKWAAYAGLTVQDSDFKTAYKKLKIYTFSRGQAEHPMAFGD